MPVYNSEKTLKKSILSVINQTYANLEIVLINDGSTDSSFSICEKYKKNDSRVVLINKNNGGQASARNVALNIVRGDYYCFIDSDDEYEETFIEKLYYSLINYKCDFSCCNSRYFYEDGTTRKWTNVDEIIVLNNHAIMKNLLNNDFINDTFWSKMFKKELFDNERFVEGMIFEDTEMIHRCLFKANKAVFIPDTLYKYYIHTSSTTSSASSIKNMDHIKALKNRFLFYKACCPSLVREAAGSYISLCVDYLHKTKREYNIKSQRTLLLKETKSFLRHNKVKGFRKAFFAKSICFLPDKLFDAFLIFIMSLRKH